jgi:hypothetical protein
MTNRPASAVLVVSLDLDCQAEASHRHRVNLENTAELLRTLARQHHVPVTWTSRNLPESLAARAAANVHAGGEVALAIGALPAGVSLRRHVAQQLTRARAAGLSVSTLALSAECGLADLDSHDASRLGVTAIRSVGEASRTANVGLFSRLMSSLPGQRTALPRPRKLRYGLWEVPATIVHPRRQGRAGGSVTLTSPRRSIDRVIRFHPYLHVVIDVPLVAEMGAAAVEPIDQLFQLAGHASLAGALRVGTIASLAASFAPVRTAAPARSILKLRAA